MAAARKRKKSYAAVVGVVGSASVALKAAKAHLSDYIEAADGEILWVLPHSDNVSKSLDKIKNFLWEEEADYALVSDGTAEDDDWEEYAKSTVEVGEQDVYAALVTEVAGYEAPTLGVVFLLDEDHQGDLELLKAAVGEGLTCYDMDSGLNELEVDEVEVEEDVEEDDDGVEDTPAASTADEGEPAPELSAKTEKLISRGKFTEAGEAIAEELGGEGVKELADRLGVAWKKGQWAKNIGKAIAEHLGTDEEAPEEVAEEPEPEAPAEKPAKKASRRTRKAQEEPTEEPVDEETPAEDDAPEATLEEPKKQQGSMAVAAPIDIVRELLHASAQVAMSQGAGDAEKFVKMVKKELLA